MYLKLHMSSLSTKSESTSLVTKEVRYGNVKKFGLEILVSDFRAILHRDILSVDAQK